MGIKTCSTKKCGRNKNRIKKLQILLHKENWTSKSPLSETMPLSIEWVDNSYRPENFNLPVYIEEINC